MCNPHDMLFGLVDLFAVRLLVGVQLFGLAPVAIYTLFFWKKRTSKAVAAYLALYPVAVIIDLIRMVFTTMPEAVTIPIEGGGILVPWYWSPLIWIELVLLFMVPILALGILWVRRYKTKLLLDLPLMWLAPLVLMIPFSVIAMGVFVAIAPSWGPFLLFNNIGLASCLPW